MVISISVFRIFALDTPEALEGPRTVVFTTVLSIRAGMAKCHWTLPEVRFAEFLQSQTSAPSRMLITLCR